MAQYNQQDEDVLSYALFPAVAVKFFQTRQAAQLKTDPTTYDKKEGTMPV
jgi:oxaloacetate decarboxylase alpha subunit